MYMETSNEERTQPLTHTRNYIRNKGGFFPELGTDGEGPALWPYLSTSAKWRSKEEKENKKLLEANLNCT
jgi:hypothetical protein